MNRRRRIVIGVVIAVVVCGTFYRWRSGRPVNIVLITLDTTRADRLGCYGHAAAETPHLDALAARGVLFERAYAPAPMTLPSHASLFTGLWPPEHGLITNGQNALEPGIPTVAESLAARGYATAAFIAGVVLNAKYGLNRGFQKYDDDLSGAAAVADELHRYRDGRLVIDSAISWLTQQHRQSASQPFLCWVHLYDPHDPYLDHADEFGNRFTDRPYDGELAYIDRQVGRLLDALKQQGLADSTCIVVVGDHGESLGEHGEETHGYTLHESTLRVPLIVTHPHGRTRGHRVAQPVPLVDLFPTLLEIAGASPPKTSGGQTLRPALAGAPLTERFCYSQTEQPYLESFWSPLRGLTTDRWRYVRTTKPELYDLTADPHELHNLATEHPETLNDFETQLQKFESRLQVRAGIGVTMSAGERRSLESLGYTGGESAVKPTDPERPLPDIKDMLPHLNRLQRAVHFMDHQKFREAEQLLEPLVQDVPDYFRAILKLGLCRLQQQNLEGAAEMFERALTINPDSDRAHDMLGFVYLRQQKLDLAEQHFKQLVSLRPDLENGHLFLGEIEQRRGNLLLACRHYETVLRLNPGHGPAQRALDALRQTLNGR